MPSFRRIFNRNHRVSDAPERPESPLQRCAPPARGSTPTARLADDVRQDSSPLLESIQSATSSRANRSRRGRRNHRRPSEELRSAPSPLLSELQTPMGTPSLEALVESALEAEPPLDQPSLLEPAGSPSPTISDGSSVGWPSRPQPQLHRGAPRLERSSDPANPFVGPYRDIMFQQYQRDERAAAAASSDTEIIAPHDIVERRIREQQHAAATATTDNEIVGPRAILRRRYLEEQAAAQANGTPFSTMEPDAYIAAVEVRLEQLVNSLSPIEPLSNREFLRRELETAIDNLREQMEAMDQEADDVVDATAAEIRHQRLDYDDERYEQEYESLRVEHGEAMPPPPYCAPPPSYHSEEDEETGAAPEDGKEARQNQPDSDRRRSLSVNPSHQQSTLTLVAPRTIYDSLDTSSVRVPDHTNQPLEIQCPVPIRSSDRPITPSGAVDWLEQQVYESPNDSNASSGPSSRSSSPLPSKGKGKGRADEPTSPGEIAGPSGKGRDFKGKGPALTLSDFLSEEEWNNSKWNKRRLSDGSPNQSETSVQGDEQSDVVEEEAGPAQDFISSSDELNDEEFGKRLANKEFGSYADALKVTPSQTQTGESSSSGALNNSSRPTDSEPSTEVNEPSVEVSEPASEVGSDDSEVASHMWSSAVSHLSAEAPAFSPAQVRRTSPVEEVADNSMPDQSMYSGEIQPDDYHHPFIHTAQVGYGPGQRNPFHAPPRRVRHVRDSTPGSSFTFQPLFNPQPIYIPAPPPPPPVVAPSPPSVLRYVSGKGFLSTSDSSPSTSPPAPTATTPWHQPQGVPPVDHACSESKVLRYQPGCGFLPGLGITKSNGDNGYQSPPYSSSNQSAASLSPEAPPFRLRVERSSVSANSSSDEEEHLPGDPSKLRASDAEDSEKVRGPKVEEVSDERSYQEFSVFPYSIEDYSDSDYSDPEVSEEVPRSPSRLSFHDTTSSASSSLELSDEENQLEEFQAAVGQTLTHVHHSAGSPSASSTDDLILPFSAEGQTMLAEIREHLEIPAEWSAMDVQDFLGRNPNLLYSLFTSTISNPNNRIEEYGRPHGIRVDPLARTENVLIARSIAQLAWSNRSVLETLDIIKMYMESCDDIDYNTQDMIDLMERHEREDTVVNQDPSGEESDGAEETADEPQAVLPGSPLTKEVLPEDV